MDSGFKLNVSTWNYAWGLGNPINLQYAISEIKSDGLGVELSMNWSPELDIFNRENWPRIKKWLSRARNISIHSRCDNKNWDSLKKEIELTAFLEADLLVVHALNFGVVEMEGKLEPDEVYFKKALDFAAGMKVVLALENGFFSTLKRFCTIAEDAPYLKLCLDIGHANHPDQSHLPAKNSINTFIEAFKEKIIHLHIHDNHGKSDEHLIPGEGTIDWYMVIKELKKLRAYQLII